MFDGVIFRPNNHTSKGRTSLDLRYLKVINMQLQIIITLILVSVYGKYLFTVTYLLICFIVAIPFNYATYRLLYTSDGIPAGEDNAFHVYAVIRILDTNNPLLSYTKFPTVMQNNSNYYPSFFHLTLATLQR